MLNVSFSKVVGTLVVVAGACVFALPAQAALTPGQANAIVLLLVSFGAEDATIANVWNTLMGGTSGAQRTAGGGSLSFIEATRPENTAISPGATTTPFTTFSLTNGTNVPATIYSITVEQTGKGKDSNVEEVLLLDSTNAVKVTKTLSDGQADLDSNSTLLPGQSVVFTIAANISPAARSGQEVHLEVVAINASVPIQGDLPISGSARTIKRSH